MSKKIVRNLLLAATSLFLFSACQLTPKIYEPTLGTVFFFKDFTPEDPIHYQSMHAREVTKMTASSDEKGGKKYMYGIYFTVSDNDLDTQYFQISTDGKNFKNLNAGYPFSSQPSKNCNCCLGIYWWERDVTGDEGKTYYFRLKDAEGNVSNVLKKKIYIYSQKTGQDTQDDPDPTETPEPDTDPSQF